MKRSRLFRLLSGLVLRGRIGGRDRPGQPARCAQIVEKNVAARGGIQAWRAITSLKLAGELEAGGKQDAKLPFVLSMERPHKSRLEIRFQDQNAIQVWNGTQGWKVRPFLNRGEIEPFSAAETKSAAAAAELDGPLVDYAKRAPGSNCRGWSRWKARTPTSSS